MTGSDLMNDNLIVILVTAENPELDLASFYGSQSKSNYTNKTLLTHKKFKPITLLRRVFVSSNKTPKLF